ncbi:MAG: type II CAAX prenyl endopeptidase Rce1 family protein [archaeon]
MSSSNKVVSLTTTFVPQTSKDKLFTICLVLAMSGGLWLSLQSAGFLLAFNVNTLMIMAVVFTLTCSNFIMRAKALDVQLKYAALAVVPIGLRHVFNLPLFGSYASVGDVTSQLLYTLQVCALWLLVAVAEESFRATMMNMWDSLYAKKFARKTNTVLKVLFSNVLWVMFHFIQRPFDPVAYGWYIVWLLISGFVMGYATLNGGLGSSTLIHFIVNLTS